MASANGQRGSAGAPGWMGMQAQAQYAAPYYGQQPAQAGTEQNGPAMMAPIGMIWPQQQQLQPGGSQQDGQYAKEGMFFMDMLVDTVRDEIAECSEKAYDSIALADLQTLLMLGSEAELREFAETRGWALQAGTVTFGGTAEKVAQLPAKEMIQQTLSYAKELEKIV